MLDYIKKFLDHLVAIRALLAGVVQSPLINAPGATGVKTVTTTAAEIFAGASRLSGRNTMSIKNESSNSDIAYWGYTSGVTTSTGWPILPGDVGSLSFNSSVATPIYMIAASSVTVRVEEGK